MDTLLRALYSEPGDTGVIAGIEGRKGKITLVEGRFPAEAVTRAVGNGYDLILSKNTLKRGYIHPERPTEKRFLIDLGVDDETFVRTLFHLLKPGGHVLIHKLCPAPSPPDKPYLPWSDGRCPFQKALPLPEGAAPSRRRCWSRSDFALWRSMSMMMKPRAAREKRWAGTGATQPG